jgi:predicted ArsR family transcriptional regulator
MRLSIWDRRLQESTRGRIVWLLRRTNRTVSELAAALGLTDNAIRAHLTVLERDGLVRRSGTRREGFKPHTTYALTPEAEELFPKAYAQLLHVFLDVLAERLPAESLNELTRTVGHRMAQKYRAPGRRGGVRERVQQALRVLGELGGLAELEQQDGRLFIRCFGCPLAVAVAGHPEVCRLVETLLSDVSGISFRERCQREQAPRCFFEVGAARR